MMSEKQIKLERGTVYYWTFGIESDTTLVFLPGLTADHRLFEQQISFFQDKCRGIVWDCPCHGKSRPYRGFSYADISDDLHCILEKEGVSRIVLIGQSLGGMIAQYYIDRFPQNIVGFISIDSAPFGDYYSRSDIFWLSQLEWMCRMFPDKTLRNSMAKMCGATKTARDRMIQMLSCYSKRELCHLMYIGEAAFIPENKAVKLPEHTILLLGTKDRVGKVASYNKAWAEKTGYHLKMIQGAAHNSNDDKPEEVNQIILDFVMSL